MNKSIDYAGMIQSPCIWQTYEDESRVNSSCGREPYFEDEVTTEYLSCMGYRFCPYCGRTIIVESV